MRKALTAAVAALAATLLLAPAASAIDEVDSSELRGAVTLEGILEHERALQDIALANDDTRAATTPGYEASVRYVARHLRAAGYGVQRRSFDFAQWEQLGPSTLERVSPDPATFVEDTDYIVSQFSAGEEVTGEVFVASNTVIPPAGGPGSSVSGCDPDDFDGAAGKIALIQRGTCPFVQKYQNAADAGAIAALIFNDGFEGREAPAFIIGVQGTTMPQIMISSALGETLYDQAQSGPVTLHILVDAVTTPNKQHNVIATSPTGNANRTIIAGAHLDSVEAGPGINDNGSGTSALIEIAEEMAELDQEPLNRVRFAFWGAEEAGLVGSTAYVQQQVGRNRLDQVEANLNFDMIGSPNFVRFVYDGDLSDSAPPPSGAPQGSAQIEGMFLNYFEDQGLATDPTAFDGRSDYGPFIANGVPAGGLFTGAEGIKTAEQEAVYGGVAGMQYDPCYHQFCDTWFNLSYTALDQMSDAAAHATWTLARSQSAITTAQSAAAKSAKSAKRVKSARKPKRNRKTRGLPFKGPFAVR